MASAQASAMKDVPQRPQCAGDHCFDVAILGAGVGGSTLAAILAHHGVRVLLVEADSHPRFTIGELTIPETAGLLRLIGERYSIPEAAHLATFQSVRHHVSSACGVKRGFTFIYHREAQPQRPEEFHPVSHAWPAYGPGRALVSPGHRQLHVRCSRALWGNGTPAAADQRDAACGQVVAPGERQGGAF